MDKKTQEGMKNLDVTADAGDWIEAASANRTDAEFAESDEKVKNSAKQAAKPASPR
ncbi:hypothetical protein [Paenibacillus hamazuiensis]|uniref:hypothetical protein n=1 Tax=Paenibacillus hamazuiensis TaxID=2936508 RepID=UPI00200CFB00|nr:hypothetical protein [Paenibacillus hamazuiensis]